MEKMKVSVVLEILGRPAEHIKETLTTLVLRMGAEKGMKIIDKTIHEPVSAKDSKTLFTTFAEVDLELDSIESYFTLIFSYMPAHIEIISPENISINNSDLNGLAGILTQRLHQYDSIAKQMLNEKQFLLEKLKKEAPHLFNKEDSKISEEKKPDKKKKKKK